MALVGKWTKYEDIQSETETRIITVNYPSDLEEDNPSFEKAGTIEEIEVPVIDKVATVYDDVYITVHSINLFKLSGSERRNFMNVNFRVYNNKEESLNDVFGSFFDEHLIKQEIDYNSNLSPTEQAYELLKSFDGFEELKND